MELLGGTLGSGDQVIFGAGKPLAVQLITIILPSSASSDTSLIGSLILEGSINICIIYTYLIQTEVDLNYNWL